MKEKARPSDTKGGDALPQCGTVLGAMAVAAVAAALVLLVGTSDGGTGMPPAAVSDDTTLHAGVAHACAVGHADDAAAEAMCLHAGRTLGPHCTARRVDARRVDAYDVYVDSIRKGTPLVLTHVRVVSMGPPPAVVAAGGNGGHEHGDKGEGTVLSRITSRAHASATVSIGPPRAVPEERRGVPFAEYLAQMRRSQRDVVRATQELPRNNSDFGATAASLPANSDLVYIFPGAQTRELYGDGWREEVDPDSGDSYFSHADREGGHRETQAEPPLLEEQLPVAATMEEVFGDTRVVIGGAVRYDHAHGGSDMSVNGAFMGLPFHAHTSLLHEVVAGAKHFMFYDAATPPPFGVHGAADAKHFDYNMHRWVTDGRRMRDSSTGDLRAEASSPPTHECTVMPNEMIFVPRDMTHATYNLVPTLSLIRSGCAEGGVPSITNECPPGRPRPPFGWIPAAFLELPEADTPHPTHARLVVMTLRSGLKGSLSNRDLRVKFLVFADEETAQGAATLAHAQAAATALAERHADADLLWQWVHVADCAEADQCGEFRVDVRALGVDAVGDGEEHLLSTDGAIPTADTMDRYLLQTIGEAKLRALADRLRTHGVD